MRAPSALSRVRDIGGYCGRSRPAGVSPERVKDLAGIARMSDSRSPAIKKPAGGTAGTSEPGSEKRGPQELEVLVDLERTGRIFGWLFIGTFVTSIPARLLFIDGLDASWTDIRFNGAETSIDTLRLAAALEFGLIITQIGTAVVLFPIGRRESETLSLGYVSARIMESVFAAIGIISIMSIVNVVEAMSASGADAGALAATGNGLAYSYERAFQWGPGLVAGLGNGLILGSLMYRSGLVPRRMALLGLVGGTLLVVLWLLVLSDVTENGSSLAQLLTLPEAAWELALGIYCAWKGFRSDSRVAPQLAAAY